MPTQTTSSSIARPFVKLAVGAFGLLIIRFILSRLPMLKDAPPIPGIGLSYLTIGGAVVDTIIFILIFRFSFELERLSQERARALPDAGRMIRIAVWIIIIALAYNAYSDIAYAFLKRDLWIYSVGCLILVAIPVLLLGMLVYKNLEQITDWVIGGVRKGGGEGLVCQACGRVLARGAKFCSGCGVEVPVIETAKIEPAAAPCSQCGAVPSPDAQFCPGCGAPLQASTGAGGD